MRVDFHDFGIFDRKQYCQGPKSKLLENSRPTACYFQWNSWKLGASIIWVMGKLQGLRPCNFQGNSWKLIGGRVGGIHK